MFHTIFYAPLYNGLIALTQLFGGSLGWAVIALTVLVKILLAPLAHQSTISQLEQKKLLPFINEIKKKFPDQKEQAEKINELYKEHKTHPLSGCLLILLQLPVLFAIFYVFKGGSAIDTASLYSFVQAPAAINTQLFGIDITQPNIVLLVITALIQFLQMNLSPAMKNTEAPSGDDPQAKVAESMQKTMKYILPVVIIAGGWKLPAAVLLYWIISSVITMAQEKITTAILTRKNKQA